MIRHHATLGRPGAGPALALSLVLVAIVCGFTALCYAELASMIPVAGSAYTYTYATMGELIAWIIGWDLILEYAVSNMAVSVGFAAHLVGMFDWFGWHPALRWISPAYLPGGLSDLKGNVLYIPGLHFGFDIPAFLIVMILTVVLVRGIRESTEANNTMVILKIAAIFMPIMAPNNTPSSTQRSLFEPVRTTRAFRLLATGAASSSRDCHGTKPLGWTSKNELGFFPRLCN
jgi:basic amino acid/polyamine antiporter, APA family